MKEDILLAISLWALVPAFFFMLMIFCGCDIDLDRLNILGRVLLIVLLLPLLLLCLFFAALFKLLEFAFIKRS